MKKSLTFFSVAFAVVASAFIFTAPAFAQNSSDSTRIQISPLTYSLTANAGDTLSNVIKVRNDGSSAMQISVQALNFKATGEDGEVSLTEDATNFSLASWITFTGSTFALKSGEERTVPFVIRVPVGAEPGGHYASVFAYVGPPSANLGSGSFIGQRIGSLVLLRVAGNVKESAVIDSFDASNSAPGPVNFNIRVNNNGSVHIRPQGFVTVTDVFGNKVADIKVDERNVLPDSIRKLQVEWKDTPFVGRFTANVLMYYGENNQQLTASVSFWILPWKQLGIGAGVVLLVLLVLWFGRKRIGRSLSALVGK